jgi:hypothetical protein
MARKHPQNGSSVRKTRYRTQPLTNDEPAQRQTKEEVRDAELTEKARQSRESQSNFGDVSPLRAPATRAAERGGPMSEAPQRKNNQTEKAERANVRFPLWRKKVDNSIFRDSGTTVPNWVCRVWQFDVVFPGILKSNDPAASAAVRFEERTYVGRVVTTHPEGRANKVFRFYFDEALLRRLKEVFLMSHMRDLESRLRKDTTDIETQIPFWEFLDIEFDAEKKVFHLAAHYKQTPTFPELFKNLIGSPPIKRIEDELAHPGQFKIEKQDWRPRSMYETELGAENVIYMLIDEKAKLLYVGEAEDLVRRFKVGHSEIKDWDFYRYDQLPPMHKHQRVAIERMLIRIFASVLENKGGVATKSISEYRLANRRIDAS